MRGCIVPGCKTGYRSAKIKCSAFKVPKNEVMRKKWKMSIPGIQSLKDTQCVCEKHFEPHCIIRKWEKRDVNGHIIASVVLQRPRLEENAVPTLFGDAARSLSCVKSTVTSMELNESEEQNNSMNMNIEDVISTYYIKKEDDFQAERSIDNNEDPLNFETNEKLVKDEYCNYFIETTNELNSEIVTDNEEYEKQHDSQIIDMRHIRMEHNYTDQCLPESKLTYICPPCIATGSTKTTLPTSWNVKEKYFQDVMYLVFMFTIDRKINGIEIPMVHRYVMINSENSNIRYFVHGIEVADINNEILPNVLRELSLLPTILIKFQRTQICQGCGDIDTNFLSNIDAHKDALDDWRHKQCTLLSDHKTCEHCRKFRRILTQRQFRARVRLDGGNKLKRIHSAYNEIDQQKLDIMRSKLTIERRKRNHAQLRANKLHEKLRDAEKRLADIAGTSIENKLLELGINEAQKLTLTEIIAAAKGSPQNRRYSQDWITICQSMNVKSPEVYEFLRSSNIIPLPCVKTIRRYFKEPTVS